MRAILAALALALVAVPAWGQSMRSFTTFRQYHGETRLAAELEYAAGNLRLTPGRPSDLYRMEVSYDQQRFQPRSAFDAGRGAVALGLRAAGDGGLRVVSKGQLQQTANVAFSPSAELALDVKLGAADADLELGGLRLASVRMQTGASRAVVRFSQPNQTRCRSAELTAGAAEVSILGLGNSRCDRIDFEGGVGRVVLDFGGTWAGSSQVGVKMALGELTLRLPRAVGVRITMDKFLASFKPSGLVREGSSFVTPGRDRAERQLDIALTTAVGGVNVEWVDAP